MSTPLDDKELSAVLAHRWAIDCLRMTLHQQGTSALKYSGPGSIRHGSEGGLEYVLYDTTASGPDFISFGGNAGEWLRPEDFFVLTATDQWGREWTASWISADTNTTAGEPGAVVHGGVRELSCRFPWESKSSAALLHGPILVDVPVNSRTETRVSEAGRESKGTALDVWRSSTSLGQIVLKKEGDVLKARLEREESTLPTDVTIRLEETLSFLLGAHIRWEVEQTLSAGIFQILFRSGIEPQRRPRLRPPIERNVIDANPDRALLLDRVLSYLTSTAANDGEYHPLAQILLRVLRASGTGIEDEALVLSTAVEGVVQAHFKSLLKPTSTLVSAIDSALDHIEKWGGPADICERIKGAIRRIKEANASEALKKLEASGVLRPGQAQKWRELRNPAAHGARSPRDIQGFVARCDIVNDLLMRLVFDLVGFKGRYTDHTAKRWPLVLF
jgi:hypothetical protein